MFGACALIGVALLPLGAGAVGVSFGVAYLRSPSWRLEVVTDDEALEVRSKHATRFRLPWTDVVKVVASPTTSSCHVDGGSPERSLLVPGDGAPAPYDLEDRAVLVQTILAHVPAARVDIVASLAEPRTST